MITNDCFHLVTKVLLRFKQFLLIVLCHRYSQGQWQLRALENGNGDASCTPLSRFNETQYKEVGEVGRLMDNTKELQKMYDKVGMVLFYYYT